MGVWSPGPGATAGNDTFTGDATHEIANGGAGDDTLNGNAGSDILTGGAGADALDGGDDDDTLYGGSGSASNPAGGIVDGADTVLGGAGNDVLRGQVGDDILTGGVGSDNLRGDLGNDTLDGGASEDWASYRFDDLGLGSGVTFSVAGFTSSGLVSDGRGGTDTLTSIERFIITGTSFADTLTGSGGRDQISTTGGNDTINAGLGNDTVFDYSGDSALNGGGGDDYIQLEATDNLFQGFAGGTDVVDGGDGEDTVYLSWSFASASIIATLTGTTLDARTSDNSVVATGVSIERVDMVGGGGDDVLSGGASQDNLFGGDGADTLNGGGGDDVLTGGAGADTLNGGSGLDRYDATDYAADTISNRNLDFSAFDVSGGAISVIDYTGASDTVSGIDGVYALGGRGDDTIVGSAGADTFDGGYGTDAIDAGAGDDLVNAGIGTRYNTFNSVIYQDGADTFVGGDGADTLSFYGVQYELTIDAGAGEAFSLATGLDAFEGFERFIGGRVADEFIGSTGADYFDGSEGDDVIDGGDGADTLNGQEGFDSVNGGEGDDIIAVSDDEIVSGESIDGGGGVDTLVAYGDADLTQIDVASMERLQFGGDLDYNYLSILGLQLGAGLASALAVVGSAAADEIDVFLGSGESLDLSGWTFTGWDPLVRQINNPTADVIFILASDGNETVVGSTASDSVYAGAGNDNLSGGDGSDFLRGENGDDTVNGGAGDDVLRGGRGVDTFAGGDGSDRISFYELAATEGAVVNLLTQTISNDGFGNAETMTSIEELGAGTAFVDTFTGNDDANLFLGDTGDIIVANGGDDTFQIAGAPGVLNGGDGNDTINLFTLQSLIQDTNSDGLAETVDALVGVSVDLSAGSILDDGFGNSGTLVSIENVSGSALNDTLVGDTGANVLEGLGGNDTLSGLGGNDTLSGLGGNDTINGGAGIDNMSGGAGDDTFVVDSAGETVTEDVGAGADSVQASVTHTLAANVENLTLTGASAIDGAGNELNNVITGNDAANILNGKAGNDTVDAGGGTDSLYGGDGDDTLNGAAANDLLDGGNNNDTLNGGDGVDTLYGRAGIDTLDGGLGADTMFGGAGDDTYVVDDAGDAVGESASAGTDTIFSSVTRVLGQYQENLTLTGAVAINGTGNILANVMTGNGAANVLSGAAGLDTLNGAGGNDTLNGGNGNDTLNGGADDDTLDGGNDLDTLNGGDGIDTLYGRTSNDTLNGDAGADTLYGGDGDDTLSGGADNDLLDGGNHNDTLNGGDGTDTLYGRQNSDTLNGDAGTDTLYGGDGDDNLNGGADADFLDAGNGADTVDGGLGGDTLIGGAGADAFVFSTALGAGNIDIVAGFNVADDVIRLDIGVFTGIAAGVLDASSFVIGSAAADANDRIIYNSATGALSFDVDGNGGGAAIQFATLAAGLALTSDDFFGFGGP